MSQIKPVPWKSDSDVSSCGLCGKLFTFTFRKHHCRCCGEVVCSKCLIKKIHVAGYLGLEKACSRCISSSNETILTPEIAFDASRIRTLCQSFQPKVLSSTANNVSKAAISMMNAAKDIVPPPFNAIAAVCSNILGLAQNCQINVRECVVLSDRIAGLSFAVLELTTHPESYSGANWIATQLLAAFEDALTLLGQFQNQNNQSFLEMMKHNYTVYSDKTAKKFATIHLQLTRIMEDRSFVLSVTDQTILRPPSLEQIQVGIRNELACLIDEVTKVGIETNQKIDTIHSQLDCMLSGLNTLLPKHLRSREVVVLDPCVLKVDCNTVLGRGASNCVYSGILYGSIKVAVKAPIQQTLNVGLTELMHEMERTVRVCHENVIKVYGLVTGCGDLDQRPVVVMELLGNSLETVLGKLPPQQLMKFTMDIICGMNRVHSRDDGVVHFDLKPQNVLLTLDGRTAKIIDFDIAQSKTTVAFSSPNMNANVRGTIAFMAPEILLGTARGFPCDVYSFGVLLFSLWSGHIPWQGFTEATIITSVQQGSRPALDVEMIAMGLPEPVVAVIVACWDQSPGNRPTFKELVQLREVDAFWEAPSFRWPSFLVDIRKQVCFERLDSVAIAASYNSAHTTFGSSVSSLRSLGNTVGGGQMLLMASAAISSMSLDQLCQWLCDNQSIDPNIIAWLRANNINGDIFCLSGTKLIAKLRETNISEWHIDAFERCYQRARAALQAETERQQQLMEARQAVSTAAKQRHFAEEMSKNAVELLELERQAAIERERLTAQRKADQAKQDEEERRLAREKAIEDLRQEEELREIFASVKQIQYEHCTQSNMEAVNGWREIWTTKNPGLVEAMFQKHYSPHWSGTYTLLGKESYCDDLDKSKTSTYASLKQDWRYLPSKFSLIELTDTFVRFKYSTISQSTSHMWTGHVRFDFVEPGVIIRSKFVFTRGSG